MACFFLSFFLHFLPHFSSPVACWPSFHVLVSVCVCVYAIMPVNYGAVCCVYGLCWLFYAAGSVHALLQPMRRFAVPPQSAELTQSPNHSPTHAPVSRVNGTGPHSLKTFLQRQLPISPTTKPRPFQPSPKLQTSPCRLPGPTRSLTRRACHLRPSRNHLRPANPCPRDARQPESAPATAHGAAQAIRSPFTPFTHPASPPSPAGRGLTTTANLSPPYRLRPTPPPGAAPLPTPKGTPGAPRLRRAQRGPLAHATPQPLHWRHCRGEHASTPLGTTSWLSHASTAGTTRYQQCWKHLKAVFNNLLHQPPQGWQNEMCHFG